MEGGDDRVGSLELDNPSPTTFPAVDVGGGMVVFRVAPLEAALAGTTAVFSTRRGGVSSPPWDALNVGYHVGDSPVDVTENRRRFFRALGVSLESLATAGQVHGDAIAVATTPGRHEATDGLVTLARGLTLAVFCADCVPIWLLDPRAPAAGLVHAGWKGTLTGVAARAVEAMSRRFRCRPRDLLAAIGPSIGPCCYEVGQELAAPARRRFGPEVIVEDDGVGRGGKVRLDLWEANRLALVSAGVDPARVYVSALCTCHRADLFHSHRRETRRLGGAAGARSGRMAALLRLPAL